jgi:2-C-methyl-D-erythritol 4-phosphate cytidylyltransferase
MKTEAIVAAAGIGKRLRSRTRKPYLNISGKPILIHTLKALAASGRISRIIVAVDPRDLKRCKALIAKFHIGKIKTVMAGGRRRQDSVIRGLKHLDKDTGIVLIHDGVRPFVDSELIRESISCAKKFGACVVGVPVKATIKKVTSTKSQVTSVEKTVDRKNLWEIQTPQVFKKDIIVKAYKKFGKTPATDDAMLVEKFGIDIRVVEGSYKNIKITTPEDMIIAEAIAKCA